MVQPARDHKSQLLLSAQAGAQSLSGDSSKGTASTQSIVPVPQEIMRSVPEAPSVSELEISVNGFCIHVTENTTPELLAMVLEVASYVK